MSLTVSLTGSYSPVRLPPPPLTDKEVEESIRNAVNQQQQAIGNTSVRWLFVDGQPRSDIVGIFAHGLGLFGEGLPYSVTQEIRHIRPITLRDLEIAAKAADGQPLKAHITGPTLMAESCELTPDALPRYRNDPEFPRQLTLDLARALAEEARLLIRAPDLSVTHLQIDEPTLVYGADLKLASEAIEIIAQVARAAGIPTILHVCGDVGDIMEDLLDVPVDILNVKGRHLRALPWLNADRLAQSGKELAIGCIRVDVDEIPSVRWLERELLFAAERYGMENIWGITPECGLRMSDPQLARARLDRLVEVALKVASRFESDAGRQQ